MSNVMITNNLAKNFVTNGAHKPSTTTISTRQHRAPVSL